MWKELPKHASLGAIAVAFMGIASLVVGGNCRGDWTHYRRGNFAKQREQ